MKFEYIEEIKRMIEKIEETQEKKLIEARNLIADTLEKGKIIFCFGTGHSHMLAEEIYGRAGGIIDIIPILEPELMVHENDTKATYLERVPGLAEIYLANQPIEEGDLLIIGSNSGRNSLPIEMAFEARKRGIHTIGITSLYHSLNVESRHPSGKKLYEVVDIVIDNCGPAGDAAINIPEMDLKVGATSTITGVLVLQTIVVEAVKELVKRGITPSVMISSNSPDEIHSKHNRVVRSNFVKKINDRLERMEERNWSLL